MTLPNHIERCGKDVVLFGHVQYIGETMRNFWIVVACLVLIPLFGSASLRAEEMSFKSAGNGGNCDGCAWTSAEGPITKDTPNKLREFLSKQLVGQHVVFHSNGGSLLAALEIGRILRAHGATTAVGRTVPDGYGFQQVAEGICASACAFAFLGGVARTAKSDELGVHQFYDEVAIATPDKPFFDALDMSANQMISAILFSYTIEMGVDPDFVVKASGILPSTLYFLTEEELQKWKVGFDPSVFGEWRIEPWKLGVVAIAKSADEMATALVYCTRSQQPRLFIVHNRNDLPDGWEPTSTLTAVSVFGTKVAPSDVETHYDGKRYTVLVRLTGLDIATLPAEGTIGIDADAAHVHWGAFDYRMQAEGAKEHIAVALKNCIS